MDLELDCRYDILRNTEKPELITNFNQITSSINSFIKISKDACASDVWTGEAEKTYYELINDVVNNYATVNDHFVNISDYLDGIINNYEKADRAISRLGTSIL